MTTPLDAGDSITADFLAELASIAGVVKYKTADETVNNSASFQSDDTFVWAVNANKIYQVEIVLHYSTNTTADFKVQWSIPAGAAIKWGAGGIEAAASAYTFRGGRTSASTQGFEGHATNVQILRLVGVITMSSTPGAVTLQWAQNTANASNTVVQAGSYGVMRQIG